MNKAKLEERQGKPVVLSVDSFANGVSVGKLAAKLDFNEFPPLSLEMEPGMPTLRSRYATERDTSLGALEGRLALMSHKGELAQSMIFFGVDADPFHPFEARFDSSMKFLNLFERYSAGQLVLQTRSPLVVVAMPVLRKLGSRLTVTIPIETSSPEAVAKFTPHLPKISERLRVAAVLRKFGIKIRLQVAPLLPYGDIKKDAAVFAGMLKRHGDYISVKPIVEGPDARSKGANSILANKLAAERNFVWLRPDSAKHLSQCLQVLAPKKLEMPVFSAPSPKQLSIFAA